MKAVKLKLRCYPAVKGHEDGRCSPQLEQLFASDSVAWVLN